MGNHAEFAEKVRAIYLEMYGDDLLMEEDEPHYGGPINMGPVVVLIEAELLETEEFQTIMVRDGSRAAAAGMTGQASRHYSE